MPSDHSISNHLSYPCRSFHTLPLSSTGPLSSGRGFALHPAGSPVSSGRIEFIILRTGRSPPVAPLPALRRRSYLWFQARRAIDLEEDFHLSDIARLRAHRMTPGRGRDDALLVVIDLIIERRIGGNLELKFNNFF